MTTLSQYPAEERATTDVIFKSSALISLKVSTLFVPLEEVENRTAGGPAILVPMTLPTSCRDVSLGIAEEAARRDIENDQIHLPGATQPTFLVASRDGYAQHNPETRLPAGFVSNVSSLVHDKNADATLLTPTCCMFSKMSKTNNLRSRPLVLQDLDDVNVSIEKMNSEKLGIERTIQPDENPSKRALQSFTEMLYLLQRLVDSGTTMKDAYEAISEANPAATSRFKGTGAFRKINQRLSNCNSEDAMGKCYWLALSLLLQQVSPVFLSPVSASHKCMAAILLNSGLCVRHSVGDFPYVYLPGTNNEHIPQSTVLPVAPESMGMALMTTVFAPVEDSADGLDGTVRYCHQKSLDRAENEGSVDGKFEDLHRILDLLRLCQERGEGFRSVGGLLQSLMKAQSSNVKGCYEKRVRTLMSVLNQRRLGLFLLVLKYLGIRSPGPGGQHISRQSVIDRIENLIATESLESNLKLVLTPPGSDPAAEWDEDTKTVKSIHNLEYFRPSARFIEKDEYVPTQQSQEDEVEREKESIRIDIFLDPWVKSAWYFLDCIVQTSEQAQRLAAMISRQYQSGDPRAIPWCPKVMHDFVQMFWKAIYLINSHIRQMPALIKNRTEREEAKSIVKGIAHGMLPFMLIELVEKHGMVNKATEGFRNVIKKFPTDSQYERVEVFGIASLAMYPRSKTPSVVGGSNFYDEIVAPTIQKFLHKVIDVTGAEKVGKTPSENNRGDCKEIIEKMQRGELVIPNIVAELYQHSLTRLPFAVDRLRSGEVADNITMAATTRTTKCNSQRKERNKGGARNEETTTVQKRSETPAGVMGGEDGESDVMRNEQGEVIHRIHQYLDSLLDGGLQYSPRTVLLQIAMVSKYSSIDQLRETFRDLGMETQSADEPSSGEEEDNYSQLRWEQNRQQATGTYRVGSSVAMDNEAEEGSVTEEERGSEDDAGLSSEDDNIPLREYLDNHKGNSDANDDMRTNRNFMLKRQGREGDKSCSSNEDGSPDDDEAMAMEPMKSHQKRRRVVVESSDSE